MRPYLITAGLSLLLGALLTPCEGASISLVNHTNTWRYRKGTNAPQSNWKTVAEGGLNATWLSGNGGIGFADNAPETAECRTLLTDMRTNYTTVAMRRTFQVTSNIDSNFRLVLTMDWDDGFIAWLDGNYLTSSLSPGAPAEPAFNAEATGLHESSRGSSPQPVMNFDVGAVGSRLGIGTHVLSIVGLNEEATSSDFIQIADLAAESPPTNGISGAIAEDTTWRAADSPIIIAGDVTVNVGVTLTIEPGVHVLFNSNRSLIINGRLLAEGDPTNRLLFSRSPSNAGRWGGIVINGSVGSPESHLSHAHIEFNNVEAIRVTTGSALLEHLTFGSNDRRYVLLQGASFIVRECHFPSAAAGVKYEFVRGENGIRSGGHGIIARNFFGEPFGYSDVIDFSGGSRPGPILHIINNVFAGATDDGCDIDGTDAWVEGNIFQHVHRRGDTPDTGAAVSGGERSGATSEITVIGNIFYDCDNAATAKQGNFFTFLNNTIVRTTNEGGIDFDSGVLNVRDTTPSLTTYGRGFYAEGNIIVDASKLVRNYNATQTVVTFNNNILPMAWAGPGTNNLVTTNAMLRYIPELSETVFTNWADAQIYRDWFSLMPGSPGIGTGPNGRDKGALVPFGASISGEPPAFTHRTNASLVVGINRTGFSIPTTGWPAGCGYTHYKYRVDDGPWSAEQTINTVIFLRLGTGPHYVDVVGKRDSGLYQDDPRFGVDAAITRSRTWVIDTLRITSAGMNGNNFNLEFPAHAGDSYTVQYKDVLDGTPTWTKLTNVAAQGTAGTAIITDSTASASSNRFYRVRTPAIP
jgi:hypothetical protein